MDDDDWGSTMAMEPLHENNTTCRLDGWPPTRQWVFIQRMMLLKCPKLPTSGPFLGAWRKKKWSKKSSLRSSTRYSILLHYCPIDDWSASVSHYQIRLPSISHLGFSCTMGVNPQSSIFFWGGLSLTTGTSHLYPMTHQKSVTRSMVHRDLPLGNPRGKVARMRVHRTLGKYSHLGKSIVMGPQMECLFLMENAMDMDEFLIFIFDFIFWWKMPFGHLFLILFFDDLGVLSFQEKRHDVENSPLKNAHEETEKAPSIRFSLAGPHFYWTQPIHC